MAETNSRSYLLQRRLGIHQMPTEIQMSDEAMSLFGLLAHQYFARASSLSQIIDELQGFSRGQYPAFALLNLVDHYVYRDSLAHDVEMLGHHQEGLLSKHLQTRYDRGVDIWKYLEGLMLNLNIQLNRLEGKRSSILFASDFIHPYAPAGGITFDGAKELAEYTKIQTRGVFDREPDNLMHYLSDKDVRHIFDKIAIKLSNHGDTKKTETALLSVRTKNGSKYFAQLK